MERKKKIIYGTIIALVAMGMTWAYYAQDRPPKEDIHRDYNSPNKTKVVDEKGNYQFYWDEETTMYIQVYKKGKKYNPRISMYYDYDAPYNLLVDDPLCEEGKKLQKMAKGFVKEVTVRNFETVDGYEGYKYFTPELYKIMEDKGDPKLTRDGSKRGKVIQDMASKCYADVCFISESKAEIFVWYDEVFKSATKEWLKKYDIELNRPRNVFLLLNAEKNDAGNWGFTSFQFQVDDIEQDAK